MTSMQRIRRAVWTSWRLRTPIRPGLLSALDPSNLRTVRGRQLIHCHPLPCSQRAACPTGKGGDSDRASRRARSLARAPDTEFLPGLRPYSSPNCNPMTGGRGTWLPGGWHFGLQQHLRGRHDRGLGLQLVPGQPGKALLPRVAIAGGVHVQQVAGLGVELRRNRQPIQLQSQPRVVAVQFHAALCRQLRVGYSRAKYSGFKGKVLDDWQLSGIIQFQSGFPIRVQTQDDNELISSLFFLGAGAPQLNGRCKS